MDASGYEEEREDPYSFGPVLTDFDLHLIGEGTHQRSYEKLGAHVMTRDGVRGSISRSGLPTRVPSAWSGTSTTGSWAPIR